MRKGKVKLLLSLSPIMHIIGPTVWLLKVQSGMVVALEFEKKYYTFIYSLKTIPIYIFESTKNIPIIHPFMKGSVVVVIL